MSRTLIFTLIEGNGVARCEIEAVGWTTVPTNLSEVGPTVPVAVKFLQSLGMPQIHAGRLLREAVERCVAVEEKTTTARPTDLSAN